MKIKLGLRYKTRNGRLAFVCVNDERNADDYKFGGCITSCDHLENNDFIFWLESGKCTDHRDKAYYAKEGFSSMRDFLSQFDLVECIDDDKQLNLF